MSADDHLPFIHLAVLLALLLAPTLWRAHERARVAGAVSALVGAVAGVLLWHAGPYLFPSDAILFLKEGREEAVLHALWEHEPWLGWAVPEWVLPLRATVFLHLLEGVAALTLLVPIARTFTSRSGTAAVFLLVMFNPWFLHAAHSESHAIPVLFCALLIAAVAGIPAAASAVVRGIATLCILLASCAAAALRVETLLVSVPAVLGIAATWWAPSPRLDARLDATPWVLMVAALLASTTLALAVLYAAGDLMPSTSSVRIAAPWAWASWHDLRLPADLLAFSAPGLAVLVLVGLAAGVRDLRSFALAFGTLLASRVYSQASHLGAAPYETLRYVAMLLGPMTLLALHAARRFDGQAVVGRLWPWVALATLAVPRFLAPPDLRAVPWAFARSIQQQGARFIIDVVEQNRGCLIETRLATRVAPGAAADDAGALTFEPAWYGWPLREGSPKVGGAVPAGSDCVLFVAALDCNLPGAGCDAALAGTPDDVRTVEAPESNLHHGRRVSPATFSVTHLK